MKKLIFVLILLILVACGKEDKQDDLGLDYNWDKVTKESKGSQVNIYMWGGSVDINRFMDEVIGSNLKEMNDIHLNRVPITDIKDTVNKLIVERQANKKDGSVDIIWINGENFKLLKESDVLWGDFVGNLPNKDILKESTMVSDFGEPIGGLEAPWGEAQFNFIYHTKKGEIPFTDHKTLLEYVKANPGRFTYPAVPDFTGSAFVRNIVIDILGEDKAQSMNSEEFKVALKDVWNYLNELKPYLWREGKTYPESEGKLDTLYKNGELDTTMGYTVNKAASKIASGEFSEDSKGFLLNGGTLFNNHYLSIPGNAENKAAALYVVNYLLSEEGQLLKQDPKNWGDSTVLDLNKIDKKYSEKFNEITSSSAVPSQDELESKRVRELSPEKLDIIEKGWIENIGKN